MMLADMKIEESSLTDYLVEHLRPLTEADPMILAEYVVALLKNDKATKELQKSCTDNLVEFLNDSTESFVADLFRSLEDGLIQRSDKNLDTIEKTEKPQGPVMLETMEAKNSLLKESFSNSSQSANDNDEKEVSDDDDRNHKHRRREPQPSSSEKCGQGQAITRINRKRNKPYENGQPQLETDPYSNKLQKEYHPFSQGENTSKFERRRPSIQHSRDLFDLSQRTRGYPASRSDNGSRFDPSTYGGRPSFGRGRGRNAAWGDSRFNPLDTLDFASQMASQGPSHGTAFVGSGLPGSIGTHPASWGSFGFIPGMSNNFLDPLHPLGMPGTLVPAIAPPLNIGLPRQRCRDFEELGFCLRGDMCSMEHGVNRIVVEDVQSLSQFNLPVSLPCVQQTGSQAGAGPFSSVSGPSSKANKASKITKSGITTQSAQLNGVLSSEAIEADVYDPDQPLWNECPEASNALIRPPSPNINDSSDADSSDCQSFRSDGTGSEPATRGIGDLGPRSSKLVSGRSGSKTNSKMPRKSMHNAAGTSCRETEIKEEQSGLIANANTSTCVEDACSRDICPNISVKKPRADGHNSGKPYQKATRTLYVNGIPQKDNKWEALLSHFCKFGEVTDIYVPLNKEIAFVQFSRREEAEAALRAPDAVMGNRFIKLWWADRDRITVDGNLGLQNRPILHNTGLQMVSATPNFSSDKGKGNLQPEARMGSFAVASETLLPVAISAKGVPENVQKTINSAQKKTGPLELLSVFRKKQESLDQKRDELRRQIDKFSEQASSVKKGAPVVAVIDPSVKRAIMDNANEAVKTPTCSIQNTVTVAVSDGIEKKQEESSSEEKFISPISKTNSITPRQPYKDTKQANRVPTPLSNRFKLDNRPTSFRVLPPLPVDLANETTLKEHFSSFGELAAVILEDAGIHIENAELQAFGACSAYVNFAARHSAEKAFLGGKYWKGHSLKFMWTRALPRRNELSTHKDCPCPMLGLDGGIQGHQVTSSSSLPVTSRATDDSISRVHAAGDCKSNIDVEDAAFANVVPMDLTLSSLSSSVSLIEKNVIDSGHSVENSATLRV